MKLKEKWATKYNQVNVKKAGKRPENDLQSRLKKRLGKKRRGE